MIILILILIVLNWLLVGRHGNLGSTTESAQVMRRVLELEASSLRPLSSFFPRWINSFFQVSCFSSLLSFYDFHDTHALHDLGKHAMLESSIDLRVPTAISELLQSNPINGAPGNGSIRLLVQVW